jgi:hypothetical protein
MEAIEISRRVTGSQISEEEMKFVVEQFIKDKKGRIVNINLAKRIPNGMPLWEAIYTRQLNILVEAFNIASKHFATKT